MATVMHIGGVRVVIYSNDHRPEHVHLIGNGCEAVFKLDGPEGVRLRENKGFSLPDLNRLKRELEANRAALIAAWDKIHGQHR